MAWAVPAFSEPARPNVLLITIDTLRADHLPAYGYRRVKTPAVDGLVQDGILFKRAVAHAPITLPSHTSILTGLYPMTHGVRNNGDYYLPDDVETLAQMLKPSGYRTAAFVSAFLLDARFGLNRGFDVYDDSTTTTSSALRPDLIKRRPAGETAARVLGWLDSHYAPGAGAKGREPFFLWAHFFDPHLDYDPPEPFRTRYRDNFYDAEIAYTDQQVGVLLERLKKLGLYGNTLVILTGDHGESLGEHGESAHSIFIYDSTQRIPLILKLPEESRAGTSAGGLARHVDIVPTVLDVLGLPNAAPPGLPGRSLLPLALGRGPDAEVLSYAEAYLPKDYYGWSALESVDDGHHKFIEAPKPELYDLDGDPREKENLASQDGDRAARMRAELETLRKKYASRAEPGRAAREPDAALLASLRASGYMGGLPVSPDESGKDPKDMIGLQETILSIERRIAEEDFDGALRMLRDLLGKNPENVTARAMLAEALRKTGRADEAVREYEEILKRLPGSVGGRLSLAAIHIKDHIDFAAAQRELSEAQALAPKDPAAWVLLGDLSQARGRLDEALEFYRKAQAMGERSVDLSVGLGSAENKKGELAQAREELLAAVESEPDNAEAHYNLAVVLERGGDPGKAEKEYRLALRYNPRDNLSYGNLGSLYQKQGRKTEAAEALLGALKIKPDDSVALYDLGAVYMDAGREQDAVGLFEKVARQADGDAAARGQSWLALARIRVLQGSKKEAEKCLGEAVRLGGETLRRQAAADPALSGLSLPPSPR